jgi:hypothetical protein
MENTRKAVVVYESMYGNTHLIADAVAEGVAEAVGPSGDGVVVVAVEHADDEVLAGVDLLVVGGPTHVHGMSRARTRDAAAEAARKPGSDLELDPDAEGAGLREWFDTLGPVAADAAAFDTRMKGPQAITGRASKGIAKRLRDHGCTVVVEPESFLVTKENHLLDDEVAHARDWGSRLVAALDERRAHAGPP